MADHSTPHTHPEIAPHDPARDINGRATWIWLIGATVGVFVTVFVLHGAYERMRFAQHRDKVELAPTTAREQLHGQEQAYLSGSDDRKSLEQAMESYLKR